jgi:GAF domain-containing protein
LLDQAITKIRTHTDARNAAILLEADGIYTVARSFGEAGAQVSENDAAILALKTWHKPIDPHHYDTGMHGALAVPMVTRARVLGVLLLGERTGGEAYAPDEIEALAQFAHGVGSSLDAVSTRSDGVLDTLQHSMTSMADAVAQLARETKALRREIRGQDVV